MTMYDVYWITLIFCLFVKNPIQTMSWTDKKYIRFTNETSEWGGKLGVQYYDGWFNIPKL